MGRQFELLPGDGRHFACHADEFDLQRQGYARAITNQSVLSSDVLASTNVALPVTNWTDLGPATSLGGGGYRFTDTNATTKPRRFYQLRKH